ncbi:MAG TPA: TspO/MBR family protein [Pyrinomonadaceae bacterium]|jgi:tryptophan-rich sensory protein
MTTVSAILISLLICAAAAICEGLFAGKNVKNVLGKLRAPRFAPPLWVWAIIGVFYYLFCFFILFRLLRYDDNASIRYAALALLLVVMFTNAFWNYVFFRRQNLFFSFALGVFYSLAAVAVFVCLYQFDYIAAFVLIPYLLYLIYAFYWSYGLLKLNPNHS